MLFKASPRIYFSSFAVLASPVPMHPQIAIHKLSLLNKGTGEQILHAPKDSGESSTGNLFWLNAARQIDWIKQPKIAHGVASGDQVSLGLRSNSFGGSWPISPHFY